jgi:signal transduction histidine kinase
MADRQDAAAVTGWFLDAAAAVVVTVLLVLISGHLRPAGQGQPLDAFAYGLLVAAGAAVGLCRRWPRTGLAVVTVALGCYVARPYPDGPVLVTGLIALLSLSCQASRRAALTGAAAFCAVLGVAAAIAGGKQPLIPAFFLGWSAAAAFLGDTLRTRRRYLIELEERARYLERTREEEARRRVAGDRLRIARDLHDSVAHAMATINVQAGAAAHVAGRRPEAVKDALAAIQRASGDVLDELAAMLTGLRQAGETADRVPTPGIAQIGRLASTARDTGLRVSLTVDGPADRVPAPAATAAYRIVQESLTNVIRHAGATTARVTVRAGPDRSLEVRVCDDGTGNHHGLAGTGTGIRGMRERAEATGGRLEAGPAPHGGFTVLATWAGRP